MSVTSRISSRRRSSRGGWTWALAGAVAVVVVTAVSFVTRAASADGDPLSRAWDLAAEAGAYQFRSDIDQTTTPVPSVVNVGRSSRVDRLHLEGRADVEQAGLEMQVWSSKGIAGVDEPDVEFRMTGGRTEQRVPGGEWSESATSSGVVAPGGDALAYLGAAKDVVDLGQQQLGGQTVTRYSFVIDGSVFATVMAQQTEEFMRRRGELAPGTRVQPSAFHRDTTGVGELWVGSDGLPVRQTLSLRFPAQADEVMTAEITVDFFGFDDRASAGPWRTAGELWPWWLAAFAGVAGLRWLVRAMDRRGALARPVALAVSVAVFATGVIVPGPSASAAAPSMRPSTDAPEKAAAAVDPRDVLSSMRAAIADPHVSLVDGASPVAEFEPETGTDTDLDGLTDFVEVRIGTSVDDADTDGDSITDLVEVEGFEFPVESGVFWYGNPFQPDSNGDRITDSVEWADRDSDGKPDDLDGDGLPDAFDDDNDGDGVADHVDLSPFSALSATFDQADPFNFSITGATAPFPESTGLPLLVDFQIRPLSQDHSQFAWQKMDWPNDDQGQIRDVNNSVDDFQLIPVLEIIVPDAAHELPAQEDLAPYSVSVLNLGGGVRAVYVPLHAVTDDLTGARAAFSGRMPYLSQDTWGSDHELRLVWIVEVANDVVCAAPAPAPAPAAEACGAEGYVYDQQQVVHRYYDEWALTGVTVTQEHGSDLALIHQDPTVTGFEDVGPTWLLADSLSERFLSAVPGGSDENVQDLNMGNLRARLDRTQVGVEETEAAYGLPNVFRVDQAHSSTFGEALTQANQIRLPALLGQYDAAWSGPDSVHPLVVSAYSAMTRSAGLDGIVENDGTVTTGSSRVQINLNPVGSPAPLNTHVGIKWTYYCGGDGAEPVWAPCTGAQSWDHLTSITDGVNLDPATLEPTDDAIDPDDAAVQDLAVKVFSISMENGTTTLIATDDGVGAAGATILDLYDTADRATLTDRNKDLLSYRASDSLGKMVKTVANTFFNKGLQKANPEIKKFANFKLAAAGKAAAKKALIRMNAKLLGAKGAIYVGLAISVIGLATVMVFALLGNETAADVVSVLVVALVTVTTLIQPIYMSLQIVKLESLKFLLSRSSTLLGLSRSANTIGMVISIGLSWGFFIAGVVSGGVTAFSAAFNEALADTISATVFAVFVFAISVTIVGLILVAAVTVIDGILELICNVGDVDLGTDLTDQGCFTLSGAAIKIGSAAFYGYDLMVDVEADDLVVLGDVDVSLRDEAMGYQVGNTVDVTVPVTNHVRHQEPSSETWQMAFYSWFYTEANLKTSTVANTLTTPDPETLTVERGDMAALWRRPIPLEDEYLGKDLYETSTPERELTAMLEFDESGVNRSFDVHLNTGYAFPATECWTVPFSPFPPFVLPICYVRTLDGDTSTAFDPRVYDVFPANIDDFLDTTIRPGGARGLAWDEAFRALPDADFDGVYSSAFGGLDPDDSTWDTDGDGLSDAFELEQQAAGRALSLNSADIDLDGLTDAQELRLGTNPGVSDTDNDGLGDGEEVRHLVSGVSPTWAGGWDVTVYSDIREGDAGWEVTTSLNDRTVAVSSNPLTADSDGDGIGDQAERQLASTGGPADRLDQAGVPYHPNIFNASPFGLVLSVDDADGFVRPGQQVTVSADASGTAKLAPGVVALDVPDRLGGPVDPDTLGFDPDTFDGQQSVSVERTVTVPVGAAPGAAVITARGTVRLATVDQLLSTLWMLDIEPTPANGVGRYSLVDVIAPDAASSDDFLISEAASDSTDPQGVGDIRTIRWPNGTPDTLDEDTETYGVWRSAATPLGYELQAFDRDNRSFLRGDSDAASACMTDGTCLTVWDHYDNCSTLTINQVYVVDQDDDATDGIEPAIYLDRKDGNGKQLLWFGPQYMGFDMEDGAWALFPNQGVPITRTICGEAELSVLEIDDANAYSLQPSNGYETFQFTTGPNVNNNAGNTFVFDERTSLLNAPMPFTNADYRSGQNAVVSGCGLTGNFCNRVDLNVTIAPRQNYRIAGRTSGSLQFELPAQGSTTGVIDRNPSVAVWKGSTSPGESDVFEVSWERVNTVTNVREVLTQLVSRNGTPLGAQSRRALLSGVGHEAEIHSLDARFDNVPTTYWRDGGTSTIFGRTSEDSAATVLVTDATNDERPSPFGRETFDVAYDYFSQRTMLVYETESGSIVAKSFNGSSMTPAATTTVFSVPADPSGRAFDPLVEFVPMTGEWLVTAHSGGSSISAVLSADLQTVTHGQATPVGRATWDSGLACPEWSSVPLVDLRFEELPGAVTFADSSRFANDGSATGSVATGVAGAPEAKGSDFAVRLDSASDAVSVPNPTVDDATLAFWFRTQTPKAGDRFDVGSGLAGLPISIDAAGRLSLTNSYGLVVGKATDAADGSWHHIAVTRHVSSTLGDDPVVEVRVFVDGILATGNYDLLATAPSSAMFDLSGGSSTIDVDHVRVYASAFSEAQVDELMKREDRSNCLSVTSTISSNPSQESSLELGRHSFDEVDGRGGRIDAVARVGLVVDDDRPISTLVLPSGVVANPGGRARQLSIGGTASDATSGIDRVEVQVNGGPWQVATGAEAWHFEFDVTMGTYGVEVRAFDRAGNTQFASFRQEFDVDGYAPFLTVDLPSGVVRPATDPVSGQRSLALSGDILDILPSDGIERVEVQLTPAGGVPRTDGWQSGVIAGIAWSANYQFSADAVEPVGSFDVRVRAIDAAGNEAISAGSVIVDGAAPSAVIDGTNRVVTDAALLRGDIADVGAAGVDSVEVSLTPLADVVDQTAPEWKAASVSGARWSFAVPGGIEGIVQVDLRAADTVGNEVVESNVWRGIVDTMAPRVSMTATATGKKNAQGSKSEYRVVCSAQDRFLDPRTFKCPGATWREPERTFATDVAMDGLFPSLVGVVGLRTEFLVWRTTAPTDAASACDVYGSCSESAAGSVAVGVATSAVRPMDQDPTRAVVTSPGAGSEIRGVVTVGFDAVTDDSIASVEVLIDGAVAATRSFAEGEVAAYEGSIAMPSIAAGERSVTVRIVTHDGQDVVSDPVVFVYDPDAPLLTIDSTTLDASASWGPGTNMYRLSGTATDAGTLQAVQVRIGDGPWIDAFFEAGAWSVAVQIPDADAAGFTVAVRAMDRAGNRTTVSSTATVDLSPSPDFVRPETSIDACVGCVSGASSATVEFSAIAGSNEVAGFECELDALPASPCSSGWLLNELSTGSHTLLVTAIDAWGFRDLSPASITWTVAARGPQAVITSAPSDPSSDRTAEFVFSSPSAAGFGCSLDGEPFEVCSSPFVVDGLSYGTHEFRVRATSATVRAASDQVTGSPVSHRWAIVNAAPSASDQSVSTTMNESVDVTLQADDTDDLLYRIVEPPQHGRLEGVAPDLVYVPFDGFVGPDAFTFEADDTQETSPPATVDIAVGAPLPPKVTVTAATGQLDPTAVNPLVFDIEFDQIVTGFDAADVVVAGSAGRGAATVELVAVVPSRSWRLTIAGVTGTGTIEVQVRAGAASNAASQENVVSNEAVVVFDEESPLVSMVPAPGQTFGAGSGPFQFDVVFDEPVTGLAVGDFLIGGTSGIRSATLTGSGSRYVLSLPDSVMAGTITIDLVDGAATDQVGNRSIAARVTAQLRILEIPATGNGSLHLGEAAFLVLLGLVLLCIARRRRTGLMSDV